MYYMAHIKKKIESQPSKKCLFKVHFPKVSRKKKQEMSSFENFVDYILIFRDWIT